MVGLGNPGSEFEGTRHNVGAEVVAVLAARHGDGLSKSKERALSTEVRIADHLVALAFPQTYMNRSGESVRMLTRRHGIEDGAALIVVHDELDLAVGRLKLKQGGGLAGHNGLKSITQHVGTTDFVRLRVGVGKPPASQLGRDWVLRRPGKAERSELDVSVQRAADAVEQFLRDGLDATMNVVNRRDTDLPD